MDCTVPEMGDDDRLVHMTAGRLDVRLNWETPDTGFG
jgi:hypothetical protein